MKIFSIIIISVLLLSCESFNDPETPYEEQYVVFANISGNLPMIADTIFVSRSASIEEGTDAEDLWVSNADITISNETMEAKALPLIGKPGRYQTDLSVVFQAGSSYQLTVKIGNTVLTSETTVPRSLDVKTSTSLKEYRCNDGTVMSIPEINIDNMDSNGFPIPSKVDTVAYNYGECFTGSFASYPMFMLDFTMDDSATLVRTLTYSIESDSVGLEPGNNEDFYDYNWNGKRDSTFINLIYDTSFVNVLWKGQYYRDTNNNPKRANPFVWDIERSPIRMSWLYFNYYGLQLITLLSTDKNYYNYLQGDPLRSNIYTLPGSNIKGGYGLFSSNISKSFYVYLKRGRQY